MINENWRLIDLLVGLKPEIIDKVTDLDIINKTLEEDIEELARLNADLPSCTTEKSKQFVTNKIRGLTRYIEFEKNCKACLEATTFIKLTEVK